jgi:hypothetical protein
MFARLKLVVAAAAIALVAVPVSAQANSIHPAIRSASYSAPSSVSGAQPDIGAGHPVRSNVQPQHAGHLVHTTINTASLFQCPNRVCNQGVVSSTSDAVYDLCFLTDNQPSFGGGDWNLVYNPVDNQVGFIAGHWLTGDLTTVNCETNPNLGIFNLTVNGNPVFLDQCPDFTCNQGLIGQHGAALDICVAPSADGLIWDLYINLVNLQVGFAPIQDFTQAGLQDIAC